MKKEARYLAIHSALLGWSVAAMFLASTPLARWISAFNGVIFLILAVQGYKLLCGMERHEIHVLDMANELKLIVSLEMAEAYYVQSDNFEQAKECRDAIESLKAHHITEDGQKVAQ